MVSAAAEVTEAEAQGPTRVLYEDIKSTMRVPYVPALFRSLANCPNYLTLAWESLKPNARIVYFERAADQLREVAVQRAGAGAGTPDANTAAALRVFQYAEPKMLLATGALRAATFGQLPRMALIPAADKRQIAPGIPEGAVSPPAGSSIPGVLVELAEGLRWQVVPDEFPALSNSVTYLSAVGPGLLQFASSSVVRLAQRELGRMVDEALMGFPYRMDISPHVLRQAGISEAEFDAVRVTLAAYERVQPVITLLTAHLATGAMGTEAARSPFPVTIL